MALPIAIVEEVPAHVVISAVYPDAVNESASEWIELYNPTEADIDIGGWTIDTATRLSDCKQAPDDPLREWLRFYYGSGIKYRRPCL